MITFKEEYLHDLQSYSYGKNVKCFKLFGFFIFIFRDFGCFQLPLFSVLIPLFSFLVSFRNGLLDQVFGSGAVMDLLDLPHGLFSCCVNLVGGLIDHPGQVALQGSH